MLISFIRAFPIGEKTQSEVYMQSRGAFKERRTKGGPKEAFARGGEGKSHILSNYEILIDGVPLRATPAKFTKLNCFRQQGMEV